MILGLLAILVSSSAFGKCAATYDVQAALANSFSVFVGELIESKSISDSKERLKFRVTKVFKLPGNEVVSVFVDRGVLVGPVPSNIGNSYLVFAMDKGEELPYLDICSTRPVETAKKEIFQLGIPQTREECELKSGKWGSFGLLGKSACNMPTEDDGKECSDRSDCEGDCVATETKKPKLKMKGRCTKWSNNLGTCQNFIRNGVSTGYICTD